MKFCIPCHLELVPLFIGGAIGTTAYLITDIPELLLLLPAGLGVAMALIFVPECEEKQEAQA